MNELAFKFGQNSITYEYGKRFVTINGEKHRAGSIIISMCWSLFLIILL